MTQDDLLVYRVKELEEKVMRLNAEIVSIERRNFDRDRERTLQERKQLLAGISFLGAMVMTMLGLIWSYRSVIFRGAN